MSKQPAETTIYEEGDIRITNARAILGQKTYVISNIRSVSLGQDQPSGCVPNAIVWLGISSTIGGMIAVQIGDIGWVFIILGIILMGFGIFKRFGFKPFFFVMIRSASGIEIGLRSGSERKIKAIVDAINEAIIQHG